MPFGYNFNLKLRAIGRKAPFDAMLQWYDKKPNIFSINPFHLNVGLNTPQLTRLAAPSFDRCSCDLCNDNF
jgi:hypothetical protein